MGMPGDEDSTFLNVEIICPESVSMGDDCVPAKESGAENQRREGQIPIFIEPIRVSPYALDATETVVIGIRTKVSC